MTLPWADSGNRTRIFSLAKRNFTIRPYPHFSFLIFFIPDIEAVHIYDIYVWIISRKVFSAHFGQLSIIFLWLSGMYFHGARFSNYEAWLSDRSASISNFRKRVRAFSSCSMAPSRRSSEFRIVVKIDPTLAPRRWSLTRKVNA